MQTSRVRRGGRVRKANWARRYRSNSHEILPVRQFANAWLLTAVMHTVSTMSSWCLRNPSLVERIGLRALGYLKETRRKGTEQHDAALRRLQSPSRHHTRAASESSPGLSEVKPAPFQVCGPANIEAQASVTSEKVLEATDKMQHTLKVLAELALS